MVRAGLRGARAAGPLRRLAAGRVPPLRSPLPAAAGALPETKEAGATAILFPSCVNRTIGALPGESNGRSVPDAMIAVAARAGQQLHIPRCVTRLCCGMPFGSKGYREAQEIAANATIGELWSASKEGALPVVVDTSPCAYAMTSGEGLSADNRERLARMRIVDAVAYFSTTVVPALTLRKRAGTVVLHPVCSLVKMGNVTGADGPGRRVQRTRLRPAVVRVLRLRWGPRLLRAGVDRGRDQTARRRSPRRLRRRSLLQQPHVRDRHVTRHGAAVPVVDPPVGPGDGTVVRRSFGVRRSAFGKCDCRLPTDDYD